jgi:DNA-directed RNA polymerase alpha subunit
MQIQRIKTLSEIEGNGSNVITKDYFDSNPVFYYSYRIFPFERGHGIFVANSIRRFLLYEIPTIAITSVLIQTVKDTPQQPSKLGEGEGTPRTGLQDGMKISQGFEPTSLDSVSSQETLTTRNLGRDGNHPVKRDVQSGEGARISTLNEEQPTKLATSKLSLAKSSATQMKKKKVTKKALKEQAAELFSYTSNPFAQTNSDEVDLLNPNLETNNQQSDQEISSLTEFTTIPFVRESFLEILLNLKACVFENTFAFEESSDYEGTPLAHEMGSGLESRERSSNILKGKLVLNASQESLSDLTEVSQELFFQTEFSSKVEKQHKHNQTGPEVGSGRRVREYKIWAKDLILPPGLKVKNPELVLATLVAPKTNCELELSFEKIFQPDLTTLSMKTGRAPHRAEQKRRNVPIDGTLFPIKKVNFALSYTKFQKEVVTFEIWTNGAVNPRSAIFQCVEKILNLFQNLREDQVKEIDSFAETALDEFEETAAR